MAKKPVEVHKPIAQIAWDFGPVASDSVQVVAQVNRYPHVSFTAFSGPQAAEEAQPILSTEAVELMGKVQQSIFTARNAPDAFLRMDDGHGGELMVEGYLVSPRTSLSARGYSPAFQFNSAESLLSNLKMDIYTPGKGSSLVNPGLNIVATKLVNPNLAGRLKELTEHIIKSWVENRAEVGDIAGLENTVKTERHAINVAGPLTQWYALLDNSDLERPWLKKQGEGKPKYVQEFNGAIMALLLGVSRDFLDVLNILRNSFGLVLIPGRGLEPGKLIFLEDAVVQEPEDLELPITSTLLEGGTSFSTLPVQQVLLRGLASPTHNVKTAAASDFTRGHMGVVGGFPPTAVSASGELIIRDAPFFMARILQYATSVAPEGGEKPKKPGKHPPNLEDLRKKRTRTIEQAWKYQDEVTNAMVEDYCRMLYLDMSLAGCTAQVEMPLDVKLWPGKRYRVLNSSKEEMFTGFLAGTTHSMQMKPGQGRATSSLFFTHVTYPGFSLPHA